jgi:hypothetical protein
MDAAASMTLERTRGRVRKEIAIFIGELLVAEVKCEESEFERPSLVVEYSII